MRLIGEDGEQLGLKTTDEAREYAYGKNLDLVEVLPIRVLARLVRRLDSELLPVLADQPHLGNADRVVDPCLRFGTARRFEPGTPTRPQMIFTKLVVASS